MFHVHTTQQLKSYRHLALPSCNLITSYPGETGQGVCAKRACVLKGRVC